MKDIKNTDELIRAKLENYSVTPSPHVWQQIQQQLASRKKRALLVYFRVAAVAAVVILAFWTGWYFNNIPAVSEKLASKNGSEINKQPQDNQPAEEIAVVSASRETAKQESVASFVKRPGKKNQQEEIHTGNYLTAVPVARNTSVFEKLGSKMPEMKTQSNSQALVDMNTGDELTETDLRIIAANLESEKAKKVVKDHWKMGMFLSSGYSSYTASYDQSYASSMTYSESEGNANMGGGFSVQYKTSKRWAVESGVYYSQNGQKSENSRTLFADKTQADYVYSPGSSEYFINNISVDNGNLVMNSSAGVIQFSSTPQGAELSVDFESSSGGANNLIVSNGEFSQVFEFLEVPLYLRYRLLDSRFGIELLTGLNTSLIVGNNAYINNQYGMQNIGKTQDISTFNISGTVGMGTNYELNHHFSLALEPRFSFFLNSINKNSMVDFRPYRFGVFAGMTYTF